MSRYKDLMMQITEIVEDYVENNPDYWEEDVEEYVQEKLPNANISDIKDAIEFMKESLYYEQEGRRLND